MGKREETRLLDYYGWCNRGYFPNIIPGLWSCIDEIDMIIQEADELIKGHSDVTPLYYQSQQEKIDELNNNYISYIRYIDGLYMDVYDVDHAFFIR